MGEPPDITVEIVSPGQSANALLRKCLWYVERGVRLALLVDPADQSVVSFRPGGPPRARRATDQVDVADVLPGFELAVEELFRALRHA